MVTKPFSDALSFDYFQHQNSANTLTLTPSSITQNEIIRIHGEHLKRSDFVKKISFCVALSLTIVSVGALQIEANNNNFFFRSKETSSKLKLKFVNKNTKYSIGYATNIIASYSFFSVFFEQNNIYQQFVPFLHIEKLYFVFA